uniref:ATP synthase F0 subunit 8 n=1 Tax=Haemaphysalis mageshimaensis TaxID=1325869 RepID=A0A976MYM0_9ACAR|nr:ATP synthase F0 subunit 8 [Haemaphysalis mageshimaensis]UNO53991.1 ATP synthase F0 subunit 8 [Haemaphysalis mageshimaensis]
MPQIFPMNWLLITIMMMILLIMTMMMTFFFKNFKSLKKNVIMSNKKFLFKW